MPIERPLGEQIEWTAARRPERLGLRGTHVLLRPVDAATDAQPLYAVSHPPAGDPAIWTYLPDGPYESPEHLRQVLAWAQRIAGPASTSRSPTCQMSARSAWPPICASLPSTARSRSGTSGSRAQLQRTTAATEAIYLLARHAFDKLGYRRLEWKCNALNAASRRAAERFGFTFEGDLPPAPGRQGPQPRHRLVRASPTTDWPAVRAGFQAWLAAANFDEQGRQIRPLGELIAAARG